MTLGKDSVLLIFFEWSGSSIRKRSYQIALAFSLMIDFQKSALLHCFLDTTDLSPLQGDFIYYGFCKNLSPRCHHSPNS